MRIINSFDFPIKTNGKIQQICRFQPVLTDLQTLKYLLASKTKTAKTAADQPSAGLRSETNITTTGYVTIYLLHALRASTSVEEQ